MPFYYSAAQVKGSTYNFERISKPPYVALSTPDISRYFSICLFYFETPSLYGFDDESCFSRSVRKHDHAGKLRQ